VTVYSVTGPDGQVHQFDADSQENAQKAFDWERMNSPAGSMLRVPLRGRDGTTQIYEAPSLSDAQKAMSWDQQQAQSRASGSTAPVSPDASKTGDALSGAWDWLKGPGLTGAVRGTGSLIDAPNNLFEPARTMIEPDLANRYRQAMGPGFGRKLGDLFFQKTGIPEYQAETTIGRTAMAAIEGGIPGVVAGPAGVALGAAGGALGQGVREILP